MRILRHLVFLGVVLSVAACSKVTRDNYLQLKSGMSYDEVIAVIGKPENCSEGLGARNCSWGDEEQNIKINFIGDIAVIITNNGLQ